MLTADHMRRSGERLFRWRSYLLLGLFPALLLAAWQGEAVERIIGEGPGLAFEILSVGLVLLGQTIRILAVGFVPARTSGRNTSGQLAAALNTTGIYSLVRNPLYLGNSLMYLGIALFAQNLWLALILVLLLVPYYERIIAAEEAFLSDRFGADYARWVARTPAFIPRLDGYVPPALPFSLRAVVRREQASVLGAAVAIYLIHVTQHAFGQDGEMLDPVWHWGLGAAVLVFLAAQYAKKHTRALHQKGR